MGLGNIVAGVGSALGLPEWGISEALGGSPKPSVMGAETIGQYTTPGSTMYGGGVMQGPQTAAQAGYQAPAGGVPSGGGSNNSYSNPPMEQGPQGPDYSEIDAAFDQGMSALSQFESTLNPQYQTAVSGIESDAASQTGEAKANEQARLEDYGKQRTRETGKTDSAIAEARRMAAQLLQGIQSLYGGTTGTGAFASTQLGDSAMRNIQGNRQGLQYVMGEISSAESRVKDATTKLVTRIESETKQLKEQARNALNQQLAEIAMRRGELAARKAEMKTGVLQAFNDTINAINQRNTQFMQDVWMKSQARSQELATAKASAWEQFQTNPTAFKGINVGGQSYQPVPTSMTGQSVDWLKGPSPEDEDEVGNPFATE